MIRQARHLATVFAVLWAATAAALPSAPRSGDEDDLYVRGMNYYTQRRFSEAVQVWAELLRRNDSYPGIVRYYERAVAYQAGIQRHCRAGLDLCGQGRRAEALPHFEEAVRMSPYHPVLSRIVEEAYGQDSFPEGQDRKGFPVEPALLPRTAIDVPSNVPRIENLVVARDAAGPGGSARFGWFVAADVEVAGYAVSFSSGGSTPVLEEITQTNAWAAYANLLPGEYTFAVRACSAVGLWSEPEVVPFVVENVPSGEPPAVSPNDAVFCRELVYVVQDGDCLSTVAKRLLGVTTKRTVYRYLPAVAEYNGVADPNHIRPGDKIRIPVLQTDSSAPLDELALLLLQDRSRGCPSGSKSVASPRTPKLR